MSSQRSVNDSRVERRAEPLGSASPVWWLVFRRELTDLWIGGRVLVLLILFSVVMSVTSILREVESQLSLIPPAEMVFLTVLGSISFSLFIGLIIGADSFSGERERATLEPLLLTPTSRRQIVLGKFLAAVSPWPVALILSVPYIAVLSQGDEVLGQAVILGAALGSLLTVAFTGFGMLVSIWSNSNRISLFVSLLVYLIFFIPTQFPGSAQKGDLGYAIQQLNPMQASSEFLEKVLVNNRTVQERSSYLVAAEASAAAVLGLLFLYAAPRLRLEGEAPRLGLPQRRVAALSVIIIVCLIVSLSTVLPLQAATFVGAERLQAEQSSEPEQPLQITIDLDYKTLSAGEEIEFNTVVTNNGTQDAPPTHVAMNIIKLGKGDPVDPEDWSPERTQSIDSLGPGESVEQSWLVEAILEGDYMVYMTVIVKPDGPEATSQPISSSGIHLTVAGFANTNPGGVVPLAIGLPIVLMLGASFLRRSWRQGVETGGANAGLLRFTLVGVGIIVILALLTILSMSSLSPATGPAEAAQPTAASSASEPTQSDAATTVSLEIDTATGADEFKYVQETLEAPAGSTITLTFNNRTDAKDEVGHNWVLVEPGQEESVLANAIAAGDGKDWLDVNDPGIIAHTKLIEGEKNDTITFDAPAPGTYTYLSTFPEQYAGGMKGTLTIK
jgi:azurin/ABC-type transport system involved in cytochrome c biogenesis permease component